MAIVAILETSGIVESRHGWERLEGPFFANRSLDNVLMEIDSVPAFTLYKDLLRERIQEELHADNFFYFAKEYPFGIDVGHDHDIVRDPIAINTSDEIICVAGIPEESDIYLLKGNEATLLKASMEVAKACRKHPYDKSFTLLFNCISRAMFLEDAFEKELGNIHVVMEGPVYGALSIGEISSLANGHIQIHNKSTVLAVIEK